MSPRSALGVGLAIAVAAAAGVVWACRDQTRLRLVPVSADLRVERDIAYVDGSADAKHRLDVYAPRDARRAPVVHFVHGGYWTEGDKDYLAWLTGLYGSVGRALAARGVVTVVQSYRLAPEVTIEGCIDDVMAALRWTERHATEYGGDPQRLFLMGHSAGGLLVALANADTSLHTSRGMDPRAVRGYVTLSAIWDVRDMAEHHDAAFNARVTQPVFGADPARWAARSPLPLLHAGMQPFLVLVGERDFPYLVPQAERARARLVELGEAPAYAVVPSNDHAAMVLRFGSTADNVTDAVVDFVTKAPPGGR